MEKKLSVIYNFKRKSIEKEKKCYNWLVKFLFKEKRSDSLWRMKKKLSKRVSTGIYYLMKNPIKSLINKGKDI